MYSSTVSIHLFAPIVLHPVELILVGFRREFTETNRWLATTGEAKNYQQLGSSICTTHQSLLGVVLFLLPGYDTATRVALR
jgi:hypothetical protein